MKTNGCIACNFRGKSNRVKRFPIIFLIVVVAILAIAIPVGLIVSRKNGIHGLRSTVLVPLYIYPASGAWGPLYKAITSHPNLNFTIIINPNSGPGSSQYPGDIYIAEVQRLNAYPNVRTVRYVRTGYSERNITSVISDVSTYSGWAAYANATAPGASLAMHGIFFDETSHDYSEAAVEFLKTINQVVKNATGFLPEKLILHNPGTIPDTRLMDNRTDVTVVFEGSYLEYRVLQGKLAELPLDRTRYSHIIHSIPTNMSVSGLRSFVAEASQHAENIALTSVDVNYYESFGTNWPSCIDAVPS